MNIKGYVPHIFTSSPKMELKTHIPKRIDENYKTFERAFIQSGVDKEKFSFFRMEYEQNSGEFGSTSLKTLFRDESNSVFITYSSIFLSTPFFLRIRRGMNTNTATTAL